MHDILLNLGPYPITGWQIVGFLGTAIFSLRWLLQMFVAAKTRESSLTLGFWLISALGSALLVTYFLFGQPDVVGILANVFPLLVALFNIAILHSNKKGRVE